MATVAVIERERKWLVEQVPAVDGPGQRFRQGYLSATGDVAVRIRSIDDTEYWVTVKGGHGAVRTEVEWEITGEQFDALWPLTTGRRIAKVRHRIPVGEHVAELDLFEGDLEGLVLVEVEFDADDDMQSFVGPDWFGADVTDDVRYSNAALALEGRPVRMR